jgi:hypothetical protein
MDDTLNCLHVDELFNAQWHGASAESWVTRVPDAVGSSMERRLKRLTCEIWHLSQIYEPRCIAPVSNM